MPPILAENLREFPGSRQINTGDFWEDIDWTNVWGWVRDTGDRFFGPKEKAKTGTDSNMTTWLLVGAALVAVVLLVRK